MAARKLQIEIDKCFKKVDEGVQIFEGIYDKIHQTGNQSQKEKLEDALKKEIKKLQRSRDQIKTWAASNDIKDKKPLLEKRKLIETQMEKFKAVEKDMKTKAYSKEGLMAGAKMDPKEKEKMEMCDFLSKMVEELERQIEQLEAEADNLQATVKKGKKDTSKAEKVAAIEEQANRHKWHQGKLELVLRTLENGGIEIDQVKAIEEEIKYYVEENKSEDFMENEEMYDDLNLQEEDEAFAGNDVDRVSSQDTQSIADEPDADIKPIPPSAKQKTGSISEPSTAAARRPSTQLKSPLPALATLHTPLPTPATNGTTAPAMKPAPPPARAPGEPLKYASAAAAAAASDKNGIGIAPLPPPPGQAPVTAPPTGLSPLPTSATAVRASSAASPSSVTPIPSDLHRTASLESKSPALSHTSAAAQAERVDRVISAPSTVPEPKGEPPRQSVDETVKDAQTDNTSPVDAPQPSTPALTNGDTHSEIEEEPIYHLPSNLSDLLESYEATRATGFDPNNPNNQRLFAASASSLPDPFDAARPNHYRPAHPFPYTPSHYPQEPLPIFDDPRLYSRLDTDTLFYLFYYRQGTYQQLLAAKALKSQSWRFHKQYSTWFQRHEEPKSITEEYEQGTYRFFDYESTWMNRRKADFKFQYKFLEDDF